MEENKEKSKSKEYIDLYENNLHEPNSFISEKVYDKSFQNISSSKYQKEESDSFINVVNHIINENSFDLKSIENNNDSLEKNEIKRPYLNQEEIPNIQLIKIKNQKYIKWNEETYKINEYVEHINKYVEKIKDPNDNSIDFLDDMKYNICKICKEKENKYFCEKCNINICDICYKNCEKEKHELINLNEVKETIDEYIKVIKQFLSINIIPIEEGNNNNSIKKQEDNYEDIFVIGDIISLNYNNFFHHINIENILIYCLEIYYKNSGIKYEGEGKLFLLNSNNYIGQFKNNLRNGKGKLYNENGKIIYKGD